jgi:GDP-D-mannose dehydratase
LFARRLPQDIREGGSGRVNPRTALITVTTGQDGSYPAERLLEAVRLACPAARVYQASSTWRSSAGSWSTCNRTAS